jgi:glycosyltransferase involved in cell wall biosynthesis
MKILITSNLGTSNQFVDIIHSGLLELKLDVVSSCEEFWNPRFSYDIVHIMWPEELYGHSQNTNADKIVSLISTIRLHKAMGAKLIMTLHNEKPHRDNTIIEEFYNIIFGHLDGLIHLGPYSLKKYTTKYHFILHQKEIQHPIYERCFINLKNVVSTKRQNQINFVVPGEIRSFQEAEILVKSFYQFKFEKIKVYFLREKFKTGRRLFLMEPIIYVKYHLRIFILKNILGRIQFLKKKLSEPELQALIKNSDILICPRLSNLNSGIPFLAATMDVPFIAPNIGNIKDITLKTGNYLFDPFVFKSLDKQIREFMNDKQNEFRKHSYDNLINTVQISKMHYEFYIQLI